MSADLPFFKYHPDPFATGTFCRMDDWKELSANHFSFSGDFIFWAKSPLTNALLGKIFKKTCACDISVTIGRYDSGMVDKCWLWRNRITEQNQNGREEIAQIIEEHIDFMTRRYRETGSVFKSIVTKIGFFPYMECFEKVLMDKDWDRLNNLIYQEKFFLHTDLPPICWLNFDARTVAFWIMPFQGQKNLYPGKDRNGTGQQSLTYLRYMIKTRKKLQFIS